jgi:hypothetical protein
VRLAGVERPHRRRVRGRREVHERVRLDDEIGDLAIGQRTQVPRVHPREQLGRFLRHPLD